MSRYDEVLSEILDEYKQTLEGVFCGGEIDLNTSVNKTDSSIEEILYIRMKHDIVMPWSDNQYFARLTPQYKIDREDSFIKVDFLYELIIREDESRNIKLVIECDGHDFHEKTKEQAQKDKSRDRFLLSKGYHVMRFTGSEIYRNPRECVSEINDFITEKLYGEEIRFLTQ